MRTAADRDVPEEPRAAVDRRPRRRSGHGSAASEAPARIGAAATGPGQAPATASGVPRGEHGPLVTGRKDGGAAAPPPAGDTRPVPGPVRPPGEPAGRPADNPAAVRAVLRRALPVQPTAATGPAEPQRPAAAPHITVNVGRVELRTAPRPAPSGTTRPAGPRPGHDPADGTRPLSLSDYLAGRDQGSGA
ncbi:hypothetical protein [Streptomyces sp. NPDC048277]|uniref:hypothetical protein n=1 Tax=Streptomyces sp. NPDC048277 TaxID=3155027 RepID=UPI0033CF3408